MKINFPTNKADAQKLLSEIGDRIDGTPDGHFDAKAVLKQAGADFSDDWKENVFIVVIAIALWELAWALKHWLS